MGTHLRPKNGPGFDEKVGVRAMKKWVSERFWGTFLAQLKASNLDLFWIASVPRMAGEERHPQPNSISSNMLSTICICIAFLIKWPKVTSRPYEPTPHNHVYSLTTHLCRRYDRFHILVHHPQTQFAFHYLCFGSQYLDIFFILASLGLS